MKRRETKVTFDVFHPLKIGEFPWKISSLDFKSPIKKWRRCVPSRLFKKDKFQPFLPAIIIIIVYCLTYPTHLLPSFNSPLLFPSFWIFNFFSWKMILKQKRKKLFETNYCILQFHDRLPSFPVSSCPSSACLSLSLWFPLSWWQILSLSHNYRHCWKKVKRTTRTTRESLQKIETLSYLHGRLNEPQTL